MGGREVFSCRIIASRRRTTAGALGARPSLERGGVDLHSPSCFEAMARRCLGAMRLSRSAKCAGKRLRVRLGLCPGSDGPLRSPARSRLRMVRHCVRLTTPAGTCSTTYQRTPRRGIPGRRPPSCFSLRLMAWMTRRRDGQVELAIFLQAKLVPQRTEGREDQ